MNQTKKLHSIKKAKKLKQNLQLNDQNEIQGKIMTKEAKNMEQKIQN